MKTTTKQNLAALGIFTAALLAWIAVSAIIAAHGAAFKAAAPWILAGFLVLGGIALLTTPRSKLEDADLPPDDKPEK